MQPVDAYAHAVEGVAVAEQQREHGVELLVLAAGRRAVLEVERDVEQRPARSLQLDYDEEVLERAVRKIFDLRRSADRRPFLLKVSFTHPHDPYVARRKYWDLYEDCPALDPHTPAIPFENQDPHSQRLYLANDYRKFDITAEQVRRSRRGYFANISYIDDHVGALVSVLERTRMLDDTAIVFCSDHGDMLGERGLWFKMCFYEGSARVPLMVAGKGVAAGLVDAPVSNLDILPTLCDIAGIDLGGLLS